jgi:hypothetical protein
MKTNKLLVMVLVLQGLLLIGQWTGGGNYLQTVQAQVPDPGARQMQMIEELKSVNTKLDRIASILEGGELQVKVAKTEESKGEPRAK